MKSRHAFSLIELLIAIGIIGVLAGLSISVLGRMGTQARIKATQSTILKIDSVLKQRATAIARTPVVQSATASLGNNTAKNILDLKNTYRQWFPQLPVDFVEADVPDSQNPTYRSTVLDRVERMVRISNSDPYGIVADGDPVTKPIYDRPAEILYSIVAKGVVIGGDEIQGANFTANELQDVDNDGLPEIVDGWKNPIHFYRWPTRLIRPGGGTTAVNPDGYLSIFMNQIPSELDLNLDIDNPLANPLNRFSETAFHTPGTFHTLLLHSGGPDSISGLAKLDTIALVDSNQNGFWDANEIDVYIQALTLYITTFGHLAQPDPAYDADRFNSPMVDDLTNLNIKVK